MTVRAFARPSFHVLTLTVARVRPGTSEGITDLLLPRPSAGVANFETNVQRSRRSNQGAPLKGSPEGSARANRWNLFKRDSSAVRAAVLLPTTVPTRSRPLHCALERDAIRRTGYPTGHERPCTTHRTILSATSVVNYSVNPLCVRTRWPPRVESN